MKSSTLPLAANIGYHTKVLFAVTCLSLLFFHTLILGLSDLGAIPSICSTDGCAELRKSVLSHIWIVPVSVLGCVTSLLALILQTLLIARPSAKVRGALMAVLSIAVLFSSTLTVCGYLFYHSICADCVIALILFCIAQMNLISLGFEETRKGIWPAIVASISLGLVALPLFHWSSLFRPRIDTRNFKQWNQLWSAATPGADGESRQQQMIAIIDLRCASCQDFLKELGESQLPSEVEMRVIHFPLHNGSAEVSGYYETQRLDGKVSGIVEFIHTWDDVRNKNKFISNMQVSAEGKRIVRQHEELAKSVGVTGTPTLICREEEKLKVAQSFRTVQNFFSE